MDGKNPREIGIVKSLFRYPVKSMAGEQLAAAWLGWHGIEGDRRYAFRRVQETGGFPWLTAGRLPALIRYQPYTANPDSSDHLPTHVKTPAGAELELHSGALRQELATLYGAEVELMHLNQGMFDEATLSLISTKTLETLAAKVGHEIDVRRFRPNILVDSLGADPFPENEWVGKLILFGDAPDAPAMSVTQRDVRCAMVNLDPVTGAVAPHILKAVVQSNQNCAGVYGATFKIGKISCGDRVFVVEV